MPGRHEEIEEPLHLAEGFMATTGVSPNASECDVRNALSRAYYALMHICRAWLAMKNVPRNKRKKHGEILEEIGNQRGEEFRTRLLDFFRLRQDADYNAQMLSGRPYFGDIDMFRAVASARIPNAQEEFSLYAEEVRQLLRGE